jgi:transcriptional regulator with XRE-family HTH domain
MAGTSAPLRRLGAELRRLRESAGRTQTDVGKAIGRTHATLVNWERGKTKISKSDLVCLLAELRVPVDVRKELERLRADFGRGAGHWVVYGLPEWLKPLVSFEEDAVAETTFEAVVIPGLLQTEDYARAVQLMGRHATSRTNAIPRIAARLKRQERLTEASPLRLHAVIAESALRLEVGGRTVISAQIEKLLEAADSANITIQVLPASAGAHPALTGNFTVLHFDDPKVDPPLGYFDGPQGGHLVSDEGDVAAMITMFNDVHEMALNEADSASMLTAILKEHRRKGRSHA